MASLARALGFAGASSLQRYEDETDAGGHWFDRELVEKLADVLVGRGAPPIDADEVNSLMGMSGQLIAALSPGPMTTINGADYAAVPRYALKVSAGAGALVPGAPSVERHLLFRVDFLRSMTSAAFSQLAVVEVSGDSMSPTLEHGDAVLVDRTQKDPRTRYGGIFVIQRDDELLVKRVHAARTVGRWDIVSDNGSHKPWHDVDPAEIEIVGRVFWMARRL